MRANRICPLSERGTSDRDPTPCILVPQRAQGTWVGVRAISRQIASTWASLTLSLTLTLPLSPYALT